ncbi:TrbG/VirB9 family P-type conjugative transfer protein [Fusobacterium sp. HMSC073F01]|uniref:TrbG/VirB9 family P-type conjugative transfer protein n=1 Tax=Fusobacterium sp. HMSC073F01 TaxID=1739251 RepID=UPI0008A1BCE6|nr:TrbG/VirB9 family P-type conjugative transfer protein [Fusobacterium sp. HMSC073F01]OFL94108.1 conjugal transfer protein TrbG [Fusobacterium sp. HMSC073F01]
MKKCLIVFSMLLLSGLSFSKDINLRKEAKSGEIANIVFNEDDKYFIYSKPMFQTTISFGDEVVQYAEFGDDVRWHVIEDTHSVRIKSFDENLKTDLMVETDKNRYYFIVESTYNDYNRLVKFMYPQREYEKKRQKKEQVETLSVNLENLNNRYTVSKKYSWTPSQIFDDGFKTYFVMSPNLKELPALLVRTEDKTPALVNWRLKETKYGTGIYVIDFVFKEAVLQLGAPGGKMKKVIIKNKNYQD